MLLRLFRGTGFKLLMHATWLPFLNGISRVVELSIRGERPGHDQRRG